MNNKILEITKQLQELAAANPGLTIYLDEEELTVMIKNSDSMSNFKHQLLSNFDVEVQLPSNVPGMNGHDWMAGQVTSAQMEDWKPTHSELKKMINILQKQNLIGKPGLKGSKG